MNIIQLTGALELGIIYGLISIGVYLTFRVVNFPDLTVDGSFPLGAAICASLIIIGVHPVFATMAAFLAGGVAGFITGYLHIRWKILGLLAGILTMTALYSINLRIMGRPNIALLSEPTLFLNHAAVLPTLIILISITVLVLSFFLNSQFGLALRATGINPRVSPFYGINVGKMTLVGLSLSNALVASGGALFTQLHGFADISMGTGTLIVGLASVIVGETLLQSYRIWIILIGCILGSVLYRLAIAVALNTQFLGLTSSDLNLMTALLVIIALLFPRFKQQLMRWYRGKL